MADIIVELDQQDHLEFELKQEDQRDIDLEQIKAVVIGGIKYEEDPVDSGFVKYNAETDKYTTIMPEDTVTEDSENIATSKAIYDYVKTHVGTKIADLVNSAPEMLDTLGEVAKAIQENETVIDALNSMIENKQDKLTSGENINIDENNVISATGGLNIADLPKFTNKLYINMANAASLAGVLTFPIVESSNFVVDWGDGTTSEYVDDVTEIVHTYSDASFAGWVYIYGDWKGIQFETKIDNNKNIISQVIYDNNIIKIDKNAFYNCTSLTSITIPDSVKTIGAYAFASCTSLTSITIPDGVTELGNSVFTRSGLIKIEIPNTIKTIGQFTFQFCNSLNDLIIPDSVTRINGYTFKDIDSPSFTKVIIGQNVSVINFSSFAGSDYLKEVVINAKTPPQMGSSTVFPDNTTIITVPTLSLKAYKTATNFTQYADKIYPKGGNYSETITISASSWDTTTNTVTVEAVGSTTEDRNIIQWNVSSGGVQVENTYGLKCTAQGTMSLTFSCETIPTEDVEVSVRYMLTNY